MKHIFRSFLACSLLAAGCSAAHAGIVITGTRVVYPAAEHEVTVKLNNNGARPVVVQSWIDDGDQKMEAQSRAMPFMLLPPLARVDPGKGQTLRMMYGGQPMPTDRESVYYLNVLEIPPKPTAADGDDKNLLQLAFRTRIKIFFRPQGLPGTPEGAPAQLTWRVVPDGSGYALRADNPTVWNVSLAKCVVKVNGKSYQTDGGMVPPKGNASFAVPGLHSQPGAPDIEFTTINDYGALTDLTPGGKPVVAARHAGAL